MCDECVGRREGRIKVEGKGDTFWFASPNFSLLTPNRLLVAGPHAYGLVTTFARVCKHSRQHSCTTYKINIINKVLIIV